MKILMAGGAYFAVVFGTGFVLGPIRIFLLAPRVGERLAELIEMPIMLVVVIFAARWTIRRFSVPQRAADRLGVGFLALLLLLAAEFGFVLRLRGLSIKEYFGNIDPVSGTVFYLVQIIFAVMPFLLLLRKKKFSLTP